MLTCIAHDTRRPTVRPETPQEPISADAPRHGRLRLVRTGAFCALLFALAGCFETEYGPLLAGRPHYELIYLEESYDAVCAIPSTAVIDTSLEPHSEHRRNALDYSTDEEGHEVVRNHAHTAYGLSDFHAERRPDYDDERGEAWLTFIHGEHVQQPPEGEDFWIAYRQGATCHPDNNLMLFPYAVNPAAPPMDIVAVPIIVDGVKPELDGDTFLDPFYKTLLELFPLTEIRLGNRDVDDPVLRIEVPGDSPAFDTEAGTLDLWALSPDWSDEVSNISVDRLWAERHAAGEVFFAFYDEYDPVWLERFGEEGLQQKDVIYGGGGIVVMRGNNAFDRYDIKVPFLGGIAHEFGHALGLPHAPCGGAGNPDPDFPHADGSVGDATLWGETRDAYPDSFRKRDALMSSAAGYYDAMGYCIFRGISPYHFEKVYRWQTVGLWEWEELIQPVAAGRASSLVLSGYVDETGVPVVSHASDSPAAPLNQSGDFALSVFDESGFAMGGGRFRPTVVYGKHRAATRWSVRIPALGRAASVQINNADGRVLGEARLEADGVAQRRYRVIAQ